jgi:hypothetical protein
LIDFDRLREILETWNERAIKERISEYQPGTPAEMEIENENCDLCKKTENE